MLYSCLVDADFLDTAAFMDGDKIICGGDPIGTLDHGSRMIYFDRSAPQPTLERCGIFSDVMGRRFCDKNMDNQ